MTFKSSAYYSRIYKDFKEIRGDSHASVIRFFESHQSDIEYLDLSEQFELNCEYAEALFQDAQHEKHIKIADWIIETSIFHNFIEYRGKDIYAHTLLLKAASLFYIDRYHDALPILESLKKLKPDDSRVKLLYFKTLGRIRPPYLDSIRNFFIISSLFAALLIALELLVIRTYFPAWTNAFELTRNIVFCTGTFSWIGAEILHQFKCYNTAFRA